MLVCKTEGLLYTSRPLPKPKPVGRASGCRNSSHLTLMEEVGVSWLAGFLRHQDQILKVMASHSHESRFIAVPSAFAFFTFTLGPFELIRDPCWLVPFSRVNCLLCTAVTFPL